MDEAETKRQTWGSAEAAARRTAGLDGPLDAHPGTVDSAPDASSNPAQSNAAVDTIHADVPGFVDAGGSPSPAREDIEG
ncbi:MAG TPA: hypothetical protein VM536_11795 [Chloroflexia bacterium]|nr:hypothetical protein [Chloroflexia bacterium]